MQASRESSFEVDEAITISTPKAVIRVTKNDIMLHNVAPEKSQFVTNAIKKVAMQVSSRRNLIHLSHALTAIVKDTSLKIDS